MIIQRRTWRGLLVLGVGAFIALTPLTQRAACAAEPARYELAIQQQPLSAALQEFAKQSGIQIIFFSKLTEGYSAPALRGAFTSEAALETLLRGTNLTFNRLNPTTIEVREKTDFHRTSTSEYGGSELAVRTTEAPDGSAPQQEQTPASVKAAPTQESSTLQEVIVTAQKRSESVQDIPIAVTAVSAAQLAELGITQSRDIEAAVPNIRWVANGGSTVSSVFIRGVGDISFHLNQVGAVALYMDEVSLNSPLLSNFGMFDLQRVEVLRGPQNTIFGRNTTGGAVQFVSQKPQLDEIGGHATVTGGNFGRFDVEGALNLPIGDRLALRLSAARFAQGDYINNITLNRDQGANQRTAGRLQLLWKATDDVDVLVGAHGGESRGGFTGYKQVGLGTPGSPASAQCPQNLSRAEPGNGCADQTGFADSGSYSQVADNGVDLLQTNVGGASARIDWRLPAFTVTSLAAFEHADGKRAEDSTGGPSYIFDFMQGSDTNQRSEELRAASRDDAPVRWIAGGYFFDETAFWDTLPSRANPALTNVTVPGESVPAQGFTSFIPFTLTRQMDKVYSGYGQLEFEPVEKLRLTAGMRFTSEEKSGVVKNGIVTQTTPVDPTVFVGADQINQLLIGGTQVPAGSALRLACPKPLPFTECYANTPFDLQSNLVGGKFSVDYRFGEHTLGYASVSRGFKAGAVSIAALDYTARGGSSVLPEHLLTYEVGLKGQWLDNRVRANSAVFLNDWRNEQLFLPLNTPGTGLNPVYTNVPRTQSYGFEEELEWIPAADWYVKSSLGLLHSTVKEVGSALAQSDGAIVGSALIASPKVTWSGLVRKEWAAPGGTIAVEGDWTYTGSQHFDLVDSPDQIEPGYWLFNSRASYQFGSTRQYEAAAWGKNLTGTQYCVQRASMAGIPFGNTAVCVPNDARRFFGLTLSARF